MKIWHQNLEKLYQQGSSKALMPDFHENLKQLMLINTAGGITSGDEYDFKFEIDSSNLCISTQAAEKIYSGYGYPARVENNVIIDFFLSHPLIQLAQYLTHPFQKFNIRSPAHQQEEIDQPY